MSFKSIDLSIFENQIVDISMPFSDGMVAGGPRVTFNKMIGHNDAKKILGYPMESRFYQMSEHAGTHVDSFYHFNPEGDSIAEIDIRRFILSGKLLDLSHKKGGEKITDDDLEKAKISQRIEIIKDGALLIHTRADKLWYEERTKAYNMPFLVESAAKWVHEQGVSLLGSDCIGFENANIDIKRPVHNFLLRRNVILLEGLCNLDLLVGKNFILFTVPPKYSGGTGAPVRAFAVLQP